MIGAMLATNASGNGAHPLLFIFPVEMQQHAQNRYELLLMLLILLLEELK